MILPEGGNLSADQLRRVEYFAEKYCQEHDLLYHYGWGHLLFACYAAFPAHLTPDLLHKLRLNFRHYALKDEKDPEKEAQMQIHPVAVNDLLLSNLVRETGNERYEMPEDIRHYLLWLLQHSKFFAEKRVVPIMKYEEKQGESHAVTRISHLAAFLLRYAGEHYTATDGVTRSLREAQEWTAQAWLDPKLAARRIREKLSSETASPNERYHFGRLGNRLAAQYALQLNTAAASAPASFKVLQTYAQGITALYAGKTSQAQVHFKNLPYLKANSGVGIASTTGTMRLPVPKEVVKQLLIDRPDLTEPAATEAPEQPREAKPFRWPDRKTRLQSSYPKAVLSINDGDVADITRALTRMESELSAAMGANPAFRLGDFFDVFIGSGRGAFWAAMLAAHRPVSDIAADLRSKEGAYLREGTQMLGDDGYKELAVDFFDQQNMHDAVFQNGLMLAIPRLSSELGYEFEHNLSEADPNFGGIFTHVHLSNAITQADKSSAPNSLPLEAYPLLMQFRISLGWPSKTEELFWLNVDTAADKPVKQFQPNENDTVVAEPIEQYIQSDLRWLEKHTMALLGREQLRYEAWDCDGERQVDWPMEWYANTPVPDAENSQQTQGEQKARKNIYVVNSAKENLRAGPGSNEKFIAKLNKGTELEALDDKAGWAKVRVLDGEQQGMTGWVSWLNLVPLARAASPRNPLQPALFDKQKVRDLIKQDMLKEALDLIPDTNNDILAQKSRYNRLLMDRERGLLESQELYSVNYNKLVYGLLNTLEENNLPPLKKTKDPSIHTIREILKSGNILGALEGLDKVPGYATKSDLLLQFSRYNRAVKAIDSGEIRYEEWALENNKIAMALFEWMDEPIAKVFICNTKIDLPMATGIKSYLEAVGIDVTMSGDYVKTNRPVLEFIEDALIRSDTLIPVVSSRWAQGNFSELDDLAVFYAVFLNKKQLLPVGEARGHLFPSPKISIEIDRLIKQTEQFQDSEGGFDNVKKHSERLNNLKANLDETIQKLKSVQIIDISGDNFDPGMAKALEAIPKA